MKTLKVLSFLLTYPTEEHDKAFDEGLLILEKEKWLAPKTLSGMREAFSLMRKEDILDRQEDYVELFDRTPSLSLHLFEHVHGDSRDRGQALVDLNELYKENGLVINQNETPDYLPLFLEFLSTLPVQDAKEHLNNAVNILHAIKERLENRKSFYAEVFQAMIDLTSRKPDEKEIQKALEKDKGDSLSLEKIDEEWEEQFAFDNSNLSEGQNAACPKMQSIVEKMNIPQRSERG